MGEQCCAAGLCVPVGACCSDADCGSEEHCLICPDCPGGSQCGPGEVVTCGEEEVVSHELAPNLMLLVDRSESMSYPIDGVRKWDVLTGALAEVLPGLDAIARLGLTMFPADHGNCGAPDVSVAPADDGSADVLDWLEASDPLLATPLGDALSAMADVEALADPDRGAIVLLISDGGESCGVEPEMALDDLRDADPPIALYIVALERNDELNDLAFAAGTDFNDILTGGTVETLSDALLGTLDPAIPCRIELGEHAGEAPLLWDDLGFAIPRDQSSHEGYRLNPDGEAVELHGAACRAWRGGHPVTLAWPCGEE